MVVVVRYKAMNGSVDAVLSLVSWGSVEPYISRVPDQNRVYQARFILRSIHHCSRKPSMSCMILCIQTVTGETESSINKGNICSDVGGDKLCLISVSCFCSQAKNMSILIIMIQWATTICKV